MSKLNVNAISPWSGSAIAITGALETTETISAPSASISGFVQAMGVGNAATISSPTTVPSDYNSLLFGPITVTSTMIISGTAKIKDLEDF
jgi:hypothetical protein